VLSMTMPFALFNPMLSQASSVISTSTKLPTIPIPTPGNLVATTAEGPAAKVPKLEPTASATVVSSALVKGENGSGMAHSVDHSAAQLLASLRNTPFVSSPSPSSSLHDFNHQQSNQAQFLDYMPQDRAMSAPAAAGRRGSRSIIKGRRGSCRGKFVLSETEQTE